MRIASDIGHGQGNVRKGVFDPGADPKGTPQEHSDVEVIADRFATEFRARGHKVLVIEDVHVSSRAKLAAEFDAKLLVSHHLNAGGGTGVEVLINTGASRRVKKCAKQLSAAIAKALGLKDRGVKYRDNLAVLRGSHDDMLIEWYFVDSAKDRAAAKANYVRAIGAAATVIETHYGTAGNLKYPGYVVKRGMKGAYVLWIKRRLKAHGYKGFNVDNAVYGDGTYDAVKKFRVAKFGGKQTGNVGPKTWLKLAAKP